MRDVKTFSNHNAYGFTVVTAITSQNTKKVTSIEPVSTKSLRTQLDSILSDFQVDAIKIGMVYNSQIIKMIKLNKTYKNKQTDTDVLTFITKNSNKNVGKILYCDIFFSIDTIEKYIRRNKISIYDHFNHLLIHSLLHINGYNHKKNLEFISPK